MARSCIPMAALTAVVIGGASCDAAGGGTAMPSWNRCATLNLEDGEIRIDAECFFDVLIERYRRMTAYRDVAEVIQITRRLGEKPSRVETRIGCEFEDGELRVETPSSQVRRSAGLDLPFRMSESMEDAARMHDLWLAPHMALRFAEEPLKMRTGVDEGYTPAEAEQVTIDEKRMVHLELTSGDDAHSAGRATVDMYVDPESLLVERIRSWQRLPDGADYELTLDITPLEVEPLRPGEMGPESEEYADEADAPLRFEPGDGSERGAYEPESPSSIFPGAAGAGLTPGPLPAMDDPILPWGRGSNPVPRPEPMGLEATPYSPVDPSLDVPLLLPGQDSATEPQAAPPAASEPERAWSRPEASEPASDPEPEPEPGRDPTDEPAVFDEPSDPVAPSSSDPNSPVEDPASPPMDPPQGDETPGEAIAADALWGDGF